MPHTDQPPNAPVGDQPLGQRLFDSPFLLLVAGMLIMVVCFTLWGLIEIRSLPTATLP